MLILKVIFVFNFYFKNKYFIYRCIFPIYLFSLNHPYISPSATTHRLHSYLRRHKGAGTINVIRPPSKTQFTYVSHTG